MGCKYTLTKKIRRSISSTLKHPWKENIKSYIMLISSTYEKGNSTCQVLNWCQFIHLICFNVCLLNKWDYVTSMDPKWSHPQISKKSIFVVSSLKALSHFILHCISRAYYKAWNILVLINHQIFLWLTASCSSGFCSYITSTERSSLITPSKRMPTIWKFLCPAYMFITSVSYLDSRSLVFPDPLFMPT